jgi:hypothetical protein
MPQPVALSRLTAMVARNLRRPMLVVAAVTLTTIPASVANAAPVPCVGAKVKTLRDTIVKFTPEGPLSAGGTLTKGATFLVRRISPSGKLTFGYAYGAIKLPGWVTTKDLGPKNCAKPTFTG